MVDFLEFLFLQVCNFHIVSVLDTGIGNSDGQDYGQCDDNEIEGVCPSRLIERWTDYDCDLLGRLFVPANISVVGTDLERIFTGAEV